MSTDNICVSPGSNSITHFEDSVTCVEVTLNVTLPRASETVKDNTQTVHKETNASFIKLVISWLQLARMMVLNLVQLEVFHNLPLCRLFWGMLS